VSKVTPVSLGYPLSVFNKNSTSNCPYTHIPPPLTRQLFLDFRAIFSPSDPSFFGQYDSPSNLVESRYPPSSPHWNQQTDFEIRFCILIEMFVRLIKFRGTFQSFWDLTEVSAQSWYKVRTYHLVHSTFKISLLLQQFPWKMMPVAGPFSTQLGFEKIFNTRWVFKIKERFPVMLEYVFSREGFNSVGLEQGIFCARERKMDHVVLNTLSRIDRSVNKTWLDPESSDKFRCSP